MRCPAPAPTPQVLRLALFELEHEGLAAHALGEHVDLARALMAVQPAGRGWWVGRQGRRAAARNTYTHMLTHACAYSHTTPTPLRTRRSPAFVNAVLRKAAQHVEAGSLPTPAAELEAMGASTGASGRGLARGLSLLHSHPTWLAARWLKRFGREEAEALMAANNQPPVYTVRVNSLRSTTMAGALAEMREAGVDARPSPLLPHDYIEVTQGLQAVLAKVGCARAATAARPHTDAA